MLSGKNKHLPLGYTLVEVLIFVAVSGFMFLIAAIFISGKQSNAEFRQGMNDINTQIQTVINDVANGNYPSNSNFTCTPGPSGPTISTGSTQQGQNQGCIFLGKVIQFGVSGTNNAGYNIYTVAGNQYSDGSTSGSTNNGQLSASFSDAKATAVISPDLTEQATLEWGLTATKMYYNGVSSNEIGAIGFFGSFGQYRNGDQLESGSQSVNTVILPDSAGPTASSGTQETEINMKGTIQSDVTDGNVTPNPDVVICFQGSNSQTGSVTIGSSGQRLTTTINYNASGAC
jgi:type II secretory pathway pseudopilin PulG